MVTLITPYRGYTTGELTGAYSEGKYEIILTGSGKRIWLYPDEYIEE